MRGASIAAGLLAGASLISFTTAARAQDEQPNAAPAEAADAPAGNAGDIVVTGSRTIKNGDASPTPVTVMATETLNNVRPTSLTESIQILPVFSGSRGQVSNPSATGGVGGGNGSAAQMNLRNIGSVRTLVLMDGRRVPPNSFTNLVDADVIPQLLIQRVDVVTGGVSAVYGSDAVSGVVNFITDKKFTGVKVQGQAGISQVGDGGQQEVGIAVGTNFAGGRGHFEAAYEFRNDDGVLRRSDRAWFVRPVVTGSGSGPYELINFGTVAAQPFGGRIAQCNTLVGGVSQNDCSINGQYFAANGVLSPFVTGAGGYYDNSLKASQRMHQAYARLDYDLTDAVHVFLSAGATFKRNVFYGDDIALSGVTLRRDNAFLAPAYQALIPTATFTFSEINNQAERFKGVPESRQLIFTGGLDGKLGNFDWNVAYTHGDSKLKTALYNNINNQNLAAALDAVTVGGQTVCYAATQAATAAAYADCRPLNLFGPTAANPAALDYILDDSHYEARTKLDDVVASIAGSPFDSWAGPVTVALSGEWRRQTFQSTSDATPSMFASCTNLRANCTASNPPLLFRQTFAASPLIDQSVWELAAEANLPLIKDAPLIQSFTVNGAIRYTKYDTVGSYWTWKIGGDWQVNEDLRLRGTISRDIRAPTLNDLYAPTAVVIVNNPDTLPGSPKPNPGLIPSTNLSNANLTAEIGKTWTVGAVYKPHYLPGFSLAVDYYDIKVSNAITTIQGFQPAIQSGCYASGVSLYCDLIRRNAAGEVVEWLVRPVNLSQLSTYGIDIEANYNGRLFDRPLGLRFLAAWQPHIRYEQPSVPTLDQGGAAFGPTGITASPTWRLTAMASMGVTEHFRVDVLYRWRNRLKISGDPTVLTWTNGNGTIDPYGQMSLNMSWKIPDEKLGANAEVFLNIQNLFDADPPPANATGTANSPGGFGGFVITDDPIGRYFTAGFRVKF